MHPNYIGNVHDVYDLSENELIIVATDRMSVHGGIIPWKIQKKGIIQTQISNYWFDKTRSIVRNHLISSDMKSMPTFFQSETFAGRSVLVKKLKMLPYEFIVYGYLYGRLWERSADSNAKLADKLDRPIFTCTSKLDHSRDVDVNLDAVENKLGSETLCRIKDICLSLYNVAVNIAAECKLILADTKFEFGFDENGDIVLGDEILTPDSSRYWDMDSYEPGVDPPSYDKQLIRNWLSNNKLNEEYQFDKIPMDLISQTEKIYAEFYSKLLKLTL